MTSVNLNTQLTLSFEKGEEPASANLCIALGETTIVMPLPSGLDFAGNSPLHISLSLPNACLHNKETTNAVASSEPAPQNKTPDKEAAKTQTPKSQLLLPSPRLQKATSKYATEWPLVGGKDLVIDTDDILNSKAFSQAYKPGIKRDIYIAGCPGLMALKKQLGIPVFKIGECGEGRIADRIRQQSKDQYGSHYKMDGDWPVQDNGYDKYSALQIYLPKSHLNENSPIKLLSRGLTVTLPEGMSRAQFSYRFQKKLASCSWIEWRKTDEAIDHFERNAIDQDITDRYTDYGTAQTSDLTQATELYCIRNEVEDDCKRLVAVIENVILEQMGLI